jgi:hypothetical protein
MDVDFACVKVDKRMEKLGLLKKGSSMQLELRKGTEVYAASRFLFKVGQYIETTLPPH